MHNTIKIVVSSAVALSLVLATIATTTAWIVGLHKIANRFSEAGFYLMFFILLSIFFMLMTVPYGILSWKHHLPSSEKEKKLNDELQILKDGLQDLKDDFKGLGFKIENTTGPLLRGILTQKQSMEIHN